MSRCRVSNQRKINSWTGGGLIRRGILLATVLALITGFCGGTRAGAQQLPAGGSATDFSSVEYFDAPNQQQIKSRISGAEAQPLSGGLLQIIQVKLERFDVAGRLQFVASAPECTYDPANGIASSPDDVHLRTGDDGLRIDGKGFLWRQSESFLTISNQIQTVIEKVPAKFPALAP